MKKFTKALALMLSMAVIFVSFAACGLVEDTKEVERVQNLKKTVLVINDDIEITGAEYAWYYSGAYNSAYNEAAQAAEAEADSAAESSADTEIIVDIEKVIDDACNQIAATQLACAKAKEAGIKLTSEDYANIELQIDSYRSQMLSGLNQQGFSISYQDYLKSMNTTADAINKIFEDEYTASLYYASLSADNYVTAKHILVQFGDDSRTEAEASKMADDIKAQLDGGADFDKLMNEKSEDKPEGGSVNNPEGYTFAKDGSMVPEFEAASFELDVDEISAPVKVVSEGYSGFHIIKRVPTSVSGIAMNLTSDAVEAESAKLSKDAKIKKTDLLKYFSVEY